MIKDSCSRERTAFEKCVLPFTANKKYYFSVLMNRTDGSFVRCGLDRCFWFSFFFKGFPQVLPLFLLLKPKQQWTKNLLNFASSVSLKNLRSLSNPGGSVTAKTPVIHFVLFFIHFIFPKATCIFH